MCQRGRSPWFTWFLPPLILFIGTAPAWGQVQLPIPPHISTPELPVPPAAVPSPDPTSVPTGPAPVAQPSEAPSKGLCDHLGIFAGGCRVVQGAGEAMQDPTVIPGAAADALIDRAAGLS